MIARTRGALLLSCTQASVAEFRRETLAPDDKQACHATPPSLLQFAQSSTHGHGQPAVLGVADP